MFDKKEEKKLPLHRRIGCYQYAANEKRAVVQMKCIHHHQQKDTVKEVRAMFLHQRGVDTSCVACIYDFVCW